jgi:hypothetical protein
MLPPIFVALPSDPVFEAKLNATVLTQVPDPLEARQ